MGSNLSRPQYRYSERRHPADYFRICDPSDCFCGGPTHSRQRNVAVHRTAGGQEYYQDPSLIMNGMLGGLGYGMPMGTYEMPAAIGGLGLTSGMSGVPMIGMGNNNTGAPTGLNAAMNVNWPPEWKDPREWTTRDYDRLGEIMDEYLNRQRVRGMLGSFGQQMPSFSQQVSPFSRQTSPFGQHSSPFDPFSQMALPWDGSSNRRAHRSRPSYSDLDQLRAQMFTYAQAAKEHMQSVNDFLYGSEREQREERYKERQRKMIEDILKGLNGANRSNDPALMGTQSGQFGPCFPGMPAMMGGAGYMGAENPMAGMQSMFPGGNDGMNPYAGMDGFAQRLNGPRQRRSVRGLAFGDGFDGQGGFADEYGGRRGRRNRRGFDDGDDEMMDMGDGRHFPSDPNGPRRPRPDKGGGGAVFDDSVRPRAGEPRPAYDDPGYARSAAESKWAAYEPNSRSDQPRNEEATSYPDVKAQASWSAPGYDYTNADVRAPARRYTHIPPRFNGQAQSDLAQPAGGRPHVGFQETRSPSDGPDVRA